MPLLLQDYPLHWNLISMLDIGRELFAKIHKQKHHAHHNHDIHFLARELDDWLVEGVHSLFARVLNRITNRSRIIN